jgi:D-3-phosphoglycerate dehydrogenase
MVAAMTSPAPARTSFPKSEISVLLLENIHTSADELFGPEGWKIERASAALREGELIERIRDVHVLGIRSKTRVTPAVLDEARRLLAIGAFCIGTNQVALSAAARAGVPVFNAPYSNTRSVAEMVLAEVVFLSRQLGDRVREVHAGRWRKVSANCHEVRGKTLGIVGYGHIGTQVGVLAEAFGMRVLYFDIAARLPVGNVRAVPTLGALLASSDFVTLHVPETLQTQGMIGAERSSRRCAPARTSSTPAAAPWSTSRRWRRRCAAVSSPAPRSTCSPRSPRATSDSFESPLRGLGNVLLTPHVGGSTEEAQENIGREVATALTKFVNSGATTGAVNFPRVELAQAPTAHRILNVHKNVPGVLRDINRIVSDLGANIRAQLLSTETDIGYLIMDLDHDVSDQVKHAVAALPTSVKTRILY